MDSASMWGYFGVEIFGTANIVAFVNSFKVCILFINFSLQLDPGRVLSYLKFPQETRGLAV